MSPSTAVELAQALSHLNADLGEVAVLDLEDPADAALLSATLAEQPELMAHPFFSTLYH